MNAYQKEQIEALRMIRQQLDAMTGSEIDELKTSIADYLEFRAEAAAFLEKHFADICTEKCYRSRLSACCSKDGIIAFFADVAVNVLVSDSNSLDRLEAAIRTPEYPAKCIFLSKSGCLWRIKPIVCEMFLCDEAEKRAFGDKPEVQALWRRFEDKRKGFTWPDRPVLFEYMEKIFMSCGCDSPLMYIHNSPGLSRIRRQREK